VSRLAHFRSLLDYDRRATELALASIDRVPPERRAEAACARARGIIAHVQSARHEWLARLGRLPRRPWVMFPDWSTDQTRQDARRLDAAWADYLAAISEEDLDTPVTYASVEGVRWVSRTADILTHVFNHATYHRGQVAMLVKACGGTPASTDFITLTRVPASDAAP
jgi:uncharacterized damage-inducible protein DinB